MQERRFLGMSENYFISESIFGTFRYSRMDFKIDEKSILGVILHQDGSKEGASPSQHGPKDLLFMDFHKFGIDFGLSGGWILRYMLIDIVTRERKFRC